MDDTKKIPDMVAAQVRLHVAETEIKLETAKAANADGFIPTQMLGQRDRLAAELDAWRYLAAVAEGTADCLNVTPCGACANCVTEPDRPHQCRYRHPVTGQLCKVSSRLVHGEHVTHDGRPFEAEQ